MRSCQNADLALEMAPKITLRAESMLKSALGKFIPTRQKELLKHLLIEHSKRYDRRYSEEEIEQGAVDSSRAMAESLVEHFKPKSVIDVGCGNRCALKSFRALGCEIVGLEYADAALAYCSMRQLPVSKFNIERDSPSGHYDMAVSFEVANICRRGAPISSYRRSAPFPTSHNLRRAARTGWILPHQPKAAELLDREVQRVRASIRRERLQFAFR